MAFNYGFSELVKEVASSASLAVKPPSSAGSGSGSGDNAGAENAGGRSQDINRASVNNEASLLAGGYDPGVDQALSASVGVGADPQAIKRAAADFTHDAERAVSNGQTLDQVRTADPNLSRDAQEKIYEQVAQQHGTTSHEIEQKAQAEQAQTQEVLQAGVLGALGGMTGQNPVIQASQEQSNHPFAGLLAGKGSFNLGALTADFGAGTSGFAAGLENSQGYSKTVAAAEGFNAGREARSV